MSFETDFDTAFTILLGKAVGAIDITGVPVTTTGGSGISVSLTAGIEFVIDGGGSALTTGIKGGLIVPFNCQLTRIELQEFLGTSGSVNISVDGGVAGAAPTFSNLATLSITSGRHAQSDVSVTLDRGDALRYTVNSATTMTNVTVMLYVTRTDVLGLQI